MRSGAEPRPLPIFYNCKIPEDRRSWFPATTMGLFSETNSSVTCSPSRSLNSDRALSSVSPSSVSWNMLIFRIGICGNTKSKLTVQICVQKRIGRLCLKSHIKGESDGIILLSPYIWCELWLKYDMNNDQYVILSTHLDKEITDSHPSLCLHDLVYHRGDDVVNVTCTLLWIRGKYQTCNEKLLFQTAKIFVLYQLMILRNTCSARISH